MGRRPGSRSAGALSQPAPLAWNFSCDDWFDRLMAGRSLVPDLPLIEPRARQAVAIFDKLRVPDIVGQPLLADAAGDWFRDIVRVLFGSLDDDGVRHVPEILALVGKKNSKTTYSAALMLTALLMNRVPRGEFLFVAPVQETADLAFQQAAGMIEADPEGFLQKRFQVIEHRKTIFDRVTKAFVKVKTFDMKVMTGSKPIGVLVDELHIMGALHYGSRVMGQIRGALESKPNSFLLIISTQSDLPPAGVFKTELQYARAVRDGRIRESRMLPLLYEFPEKWQTDLEKPWADPRYWPMVMPNLGRSLQLDAMVAGYRAAKDKGAEEERSWASQHLNVEIGLALHSDRWRGADYWERAGSKPQVLRPRGLDLGELLARSEVVTVGVDGGGLDDLFGLSVVGREKETRHWLHWSHAWVQRDVLDLRKDIAPRLLDFEADGDLTINDDPTDDVEQIADTIERIYDTGLFPDQEGIGCDPAGISAVIEALADREIETTDNGGPVCAVYQGYRLSGAIWELERRLKAGTFFHSNQPMMAWCVGNAKAEPKGNAVLITKQVSGKAKIDPLIATFNAVKLMSTNPDARSSVYESHGLRVL